MESYLLSPLDNFSFTHFPHQNSNDSDKPQSPCSPHSLPHTPLPKSNHNDWYDLLDGPQTGQFPHNQWESPPLHRGQIHASPWRPHLFRSMSDSFSESPSSSSSILSSTTCSPWETCPGLAPASPEFLAHEHSDTQYPGPLHFSPSSESPAHAFNDLSLTSPLRSPIMLPSFAESGTVDPLSLLNPPTTSEAANNALALELSATIARLERFTPQRSNPATPPRSKSPSPLATGPENSSRRSSSFQFGGSSDDARPLSVVFSSEQSLHNRSTRRKTSRVDYSEEDYDGDSDDDYEEGEDFGSPRLAKKARKSSSRATSFSFGSDDALSDDGQRPVARGRKPGFKGVGRGNGGKGVKPGANLKRKSKKRHYCLKEGCPASFTRITDMERHVASVHRSNDSNANKCSFCCKAFSREDAVLRHENDSCPMRPKKNAAERWT